MGVWKSITFRHNITCTVIRRGYALAYGEDIIHGRRSISCGSSALMPHSLYLSRCLCSMTIQSNDRSQVNTIDTDRLGEYRLQRERKRELQQSSLAWTIDVAMVDAVLVDASQPLLRSTLG